MSRRCELKWLCSPYKQAVHSHTLLYAPQNIQIECRSYYLLSNCIETKCRANYFSRLRINTNRDLKKKNEETNTIEKIHDTHSVLIYNYVFVVRVY